MNYKSQHLSDINNTEERRSTSMHNSINGVVEMAGRYLLNNSSDLNTEEENEIERCLTWLLSNKTVVSELKPILKRRVTRGDQRMKDLEISYVIQVFLATLSRTDDCIISGAGGSAGLNNGMSNDGVGWSWNYFMTLKILGALIIALFPSDVHILNAVLKVLLAIRKDLEKGKTNELLTESNSLYESSAMLGGNSRLLANLDDDSLLHLLCGVEKIKSPKSEYQRIKPLQDPDSDDFTKIEEGLKNRIIESLNDQLEPSTNPWGDVNSPAIEALEQQSRTVMVFGEPFDGVVWVIRSVLKRRRAKSQKMCIIIVCDASDMSETYASTVSACMEFIGRHQHRLDASLVMVPFSAIGNLMAVVDRVVVGVKNCFSDGSALAMRGTKAICSCAKQHNKAIVVVTTLISVADFDSEIFIKAKNIHNEEVIQFSDVSFYVTPYGMFPPSAMKHEIDRQIHSREKDLVDFFLSLGPEHTNTAYKRLLHMGLIQEEENINK